MSFYLAKIKNYIRHLGFDIIRFHKSDFGINPYADMAQLVRDTTSNLLIFDVGANLGESIRSFKSFLPNAVIHAFEPNQASFKILQDNVLSYKNVTTWNLGVGSRDYSGSLYCNEYALMSSFRQSDTYGFGKILHEQQVDIVKLDNFVKSHSLSVPEILKIDVQGFELNVLLGALEMLEKQTISLVHLELTFSPMYLGQDHHLEILSFMYKHNYKLVGIYRQHFQDSLLSWADALFVSDKSDYLP